MIRKLLPTTLIIFFTQIASKLVSKLPRQEKMTYDVDLVKFKNL